MSAMYFGAQPVKALNTIAHNLNVILCRTGNQYSFLRTGVIWALREQPVKSLAAEFWTRCSLSNKEPGSPQYKVLFMSSRDITMACTTVLRESLVSVF